MERQEISLMGRVDMSHESQHATEPDEESVLADLYGPPNMQGFYIGEGP